MELRFPNDAGDFISQIMDYIIVNENIRIQIKGRTVSDGNLNTENIKVWSFSLKDRFRTRQDKMSSEG